MHDARETSDTGQYGGYVKVLRAEDEFQTLKRQVSLSFVGLNLPVSSPLSKLPLLLRHHDIHHWNRGRTTDSVFLYKRWRETT